MQSIVWDTSIYIAKTRSGFKWDLDIDEKSVLSSVVIAELLTGYAFLQQAEINNFIQFTNLMKERNRIFAPSNNDWISTGITIGKIIKSRPDLKSKKALLFNDCLIAASSRQINAKVITANIRDFELIRGYLNFDVGYQPC